MAFAQTLDHEDFRRFCPAIDNPPAHIQPKRWIGRDEGDRTILMSRRYEGIVPLEF